MLCVHHGKVCPVHPELMKRGPCFPTCPPPPWLDTPNVCRLKDPVSHGCLISGCVSPPKIDVCIDSVLVYPKNIYLHI